MIINAICLITVFFAARIIYGSYLVSSRIQSGASFFPSARTDPSLFPSQSYNFYKTMWTNKSEIPLFLHCLSLSSLPSFSPLAFDASSTISLTSSLFRCSQSSSKGSTQP